VVMCNYDSSSVPICSVTCAEKKMRELDSIKFAKRTLEIPLPSVLIVRFVLRQVHPEYAQVVDL
jgi:hypothetical protein